jgi:uncharacterized protein YqeY
MKLAEQIGEDLKNALRSQDTLSTSVLRLLKAELQNAAIHTGTELGDEDIIKIIRREAKKRQDAVELYTRTGHPDRAELEQAEILILQHYLPAPADLAAVEVAARSKLTELGAPTPQIKGQLIRHLTEQFSGTLEGKDAAAIVDRIFAEVSA